MCGEESIKEKLEGPERVKVKRRIGVKSGVRSVRKQTEVERRQKDNRSE